MPNKMTASDFEKKFSEVDENNEYTLNSYYIGSRETVNVTHRVCGYTWDVVSGNFVKKNGTRCPVCMRKKAIEKTSRALIHKTSEFVEKVSELVGNEYSVLGEYVNARTKIIVKHNLCGNVYDVRPDDFKHGRRCPVCSLDIKRAKRAKTTSQFLKEVTNLVGDEYSLKSEYINWKTKVTLVHNICGNVWEVEPNSFLQGRRCPVCNQPHGERFIKDYLDRNEIEYVYQYRVEELKDKRRLSYDFLIPETNTLIEYQGGQHFFPVNFFGGTDGFERQQRHDEMKRNYAQDNGYNLLEISYKFDTYDKVANELETQLSNV